MFDTSTLINTPEQRKNAPIIQHLHLIVDPGAAKSVSP